MDIVEFEARQRAQYKAHRKDKMIPSRFKCQSFEQWLLTGYLEAVTEVKSLHQAMLDMLCAVVGEGSGGKRLMRTPKTAFMAREESRMDSEIGEFAITHDQRRVLQELLSRETTTRIYFWSTADECVERGWVKRGEHGRYELTDLGRECARQLGMKA